MKRGSTKGEKKDKNGMRLIGYLSIDRFALRNRNSNDEGKRALKGVKVENTMCSRNGNLI